MAHFAEIQNNVVTRIIVISNDDIKDENGIEQEQIGRELCERLIGPGYWVQTSFNNNFRKQYGQVGFTYNPDADIFIGFPPYSDWVLDSNFDWQPPVPKPNNATQFTYWDQDTHQWIEPMELPV